MKKSDEYWLASDGGQHDPQTPENSRPLKFSGVPWSLSLGSGLAVAASVSVLTLIFCALLGDARYADSGFWDFGRAQGGGQLVEFVTNAVFPWIFEPVFARMFFSIPWGYELYIGLLLGLAAVGFSQLLRWYGFLSGETEAQGRRPGRNEVFGALAVLSALLLFGLDTPLACLLALFPWYLKDLSFLLSGYSPGKSVFFRFAVVSVFASFLSNQLAAFIPLLSFLIVLSEKDIRENRHLAFAVFIGIAPALLRMMLTPEAIFPELGKGGHVVPALGLTDRVRPLFGSEPEWNSYNWARSRTVYRPYALFVFASSLVFLLLSERNLRKGRRVLPSGIPRAAAVLALFAVLDSRVFAASEAEIFPLQAIARLIPELSYLPLGKYVIGIALVLLIISSAQARRLGAVFGATVVLGLGLIHVIPQTVVFPRTLERGDGRPVSEFLADAEKTDDIGLRLFSPSYSVFRAAGYSSLKVIPPDDEGELHPIGAENISFGGSGKIEDMPLMFDGNVKTRWANGTGRQEGHERVDIRFHNQAYRKFRTMKLALGPFVSDFPRGLRASVFEPGGALCGTVQAVPWEGPIEFNSAGFPYFGYQQDVTLRFEKVCTAERITLEQLGKDKNFDWSIAEIMIR